MNMKDKQNPNQKWLFHLAPPITKEEYQNGALRTKDKCGPNLCYFRFEFKLFGLHFIFYVNLNVF